MNQTSIKIFAFLILLISCNRNSNELPKPTFGSEKILEKIVSIQGKEVLKVVLRRNQSVQEDFYTVTATNISGETLSDFTMVIESCNGTQNYDNCGRQYSVEIDGTLTDGAETAPRKIAALKLTGESTVQVYLPEFAGKKFLVDVIGTSSGNFPILSTVVYTDKDSTIAYGQAKSFIQADGTTLVRLVAFNIKDARTTFYNISGRVLNDSLLIGAFGPDTGNLPTLPILKNSFFSSSASNIKLGNSLQVFTQIKLTHK